MKNTVCSVCGKQFASVRNINKHMNTVHNKIVDTSMVECDLCDSKFKYNKNLYAHKRTIHNCSPEQANPKKKNSLV